MNKKGMEVQTLVTLIVAVVFLLVIIGAFITLSSGILSGESSVCERTLGFIRGCR